MTRQLPQRQLLLLIFRLRFPSSTSINGVSVESGKTLVYTDSTSLNGTTIPASATLVTTATPVTATVTTACGTAAHCAVAASPTQALFYNHRDPRQARQCSTIFPPSSTLSPECSTASRIPMWQEPLEPEPSPSILHRSLYPRRRHTLSYQQGFGFYGRCRRFSLFVAINTTTQVDWEVYVYKGTWATN